MQELTARIQPYVDDDLSAWSRVVTPAKLIVQFRDGQTVEARVDYPKGHPKNPMTEAEFAAKTNDCATFAARPLAPDTPNRLISTVGELERLADISELVGVVTPCQTKSGAERVEPDPIASPDEKSAPAAV